MRCDMGLGFLTLEDSIDGVLLCPGTDACRRIVLPSTLALSFHIALVFLRVWYFYVCFKVLIDVAFITS